MTNNKNEEQETKKYTVNKSSTEEVTEEPSLNRGNKANQKTSATDITEENSDPENKNAGINSRKQALEEEAEKQKSKKTKTET